MSDVRKLAKIVADHSRQIKGLSGGPQAAYSSIEGGSMDSYDSDGKLRLRIGAQDDGTQGVKYVQGPPPPRPTAPVVSVDGPVVRVRWDGMLLGGHIPEDFARIDVHFALASDDLEADEAVRGNLATSAGNETVLAATQTGTYRVGLVAMSQSRARSEMSEVVDVDVTLVDLEGALDAVVENARGGSNYYSPEPPSGTDHDPDRDLWFDTSVDAEGLVSYSPHRWDADLQEWVSVADQRTAALQDALGDFEGTVEQRFADAGGRIDGLETSLTELDSTTLPGLRQDLDAAEGRLGEAEGQITDAFGQLEAVPGQISDAQQAAINAAAQDAETKANAAQQAAQDHADLVAQGAEDDAIAAAEIRAQQLADAAQQAAEEAAQTKADAARDAAISAAIEEMGGIPRPSYGNTPPNHEAADGSVYFQTDPSAFAQYEWTGMPHASESIKYADGVEVARNLSTNPSFEDSAATGMITGSQVTVAGRTAQSDRVFTGTYSGILSWAAGASRVQTIAQQEVSVTPGQWVAFSAHVATTATGQLYPAGIFSERTGANVHITHHYLGEHEQAGQNAMTRFVYAVQASSPDVARMRVGLSFSSTAGQFSSPEPDGWGYVDGWQVAVADTQAEALAQVEEYFDGDTPDGVINWQNKVTAQWERRDGEWIQVPIRSEAIANLDVGKLTSGTAEIAELVSRKIAAATGQFLELDVGQLTVTEQSKLADVVAEQIAADTARFMELEVGKLVASEGILDEAVIKQLFAEVVVSQMSFADEFIGGNAILEGSITAESGIIGSLDLGVAIVGKLHGQYVEAGSIDTEQLAFGAATGDVLSVDALNFKTAVGLDIRGSSFRAGDAVEMTEDFGIRQFGPDGALNVSLPSDGSPAEFRGDLSARTLTATGRMSIQGPGAVASGGVLELESGVVPPVAGPQITNVWDRITMPPVADDESVWGPTWAGGSWWRAINKRGVVVGDRIERISPTGELEASFPTDVNPRGLTSIGDELFLLGTLHANSQGADQVLVYSLTGTLKRRWEYPNYGTGTYQPGIGTDGTDILIAQCWQDGLLTWRRFNKTTGALVSTHNTSHNFRADVSGIYIGAADFGATRVVVGKKAQTAGFRHLSVFDTSSPYDYRQDLSWYAADMRPPAGFAWDGQQFHSLTPEGDLVSYQSHETGRFIGDDEDDWWGAASWVTLNMGETTVGPASRFRYLHRAKLRLQYGDVPAGVEAANSWFAKGPTAPARTDLHWVNYSTTPAAPAAIASISSGWGQARSPLAVGTFTADTPGEIHSALGNFRVDGAGAGSWGPLTFHADGSMTSAAVPTWTPITSFSAGFTAATWTDVPAYRVWPDGKVEWRGTITGTFNGTMFPFVVPPAARSGRTLNFSVACGGTAAGTSATTRLEFSPANDPGGIRVFRGDSDKTWVDLGSIYYYLT